MNQDVIFSIENQIGFITLNRPDALNALSCSMIQMIYQQLQQWKTDDRVRLVFMKAVDGKAFCAGGDVRWLYEKGRFERDLAISFFDLEYTLNQLIHEYPKPYLALMDGLTMGGGVGVSLHGAYPIASERFLFAMPETMIGFFPDIGASHLLARCTPSMGMYLGLTGERLNARDAMQLGLIKQVICSSDIPKLWRALLTINWTERPMEQLEACLVEFQKPEVESSLEQHETEIDQCFQYQSVHDIFTGLNQCDTEWSHRILSSLQKRSPLSLSVTCTQLTRARGLTLKQCLDMDRHLVRHFIADHDFYEGVRALLIDKDQTPRWSPACLDDIKKNQIAAYFEPSYFP